MLIVTKPSLHNHLLHYLIIVLLWKKVLIRLVKIHDMDVDILMVLLSGWWKSDTLLTLNWYYDHCCQLESQVLAKFPRTTIVASDLDPCLDENVQFSSLLYEAGAKVADLHVVFF